MKKTIMFALLAISIGSCQKSAAPNATDIISSYYKNKYIPTSVILDEQKRKILDTVVIRLTEKNESPVIIQYIVNDFKIKYGQ